MATAALSMGPTLTLQLTMGGGEERRKSFDITVEDENGARKVVPVFIVPRDEISGIGQVTSDGEISIRKGVQPVLLPILIQKLYYESIGYGAEQTGAAAMLYGARVLNPDDFSELVRVLGANTTALGAPRSGEGNQEYYLDCFSNYNSHYRKNKWIARARNYNAAGITEMAMDFGRGAIVAQRVLEEGPIFRVIAPGVREEIAPPLREVLPEIVGSLENLAHMLREKKGKILVSVSDPLLVRALYLFTEEFVRGSPVKFIDDACTLGESVIQFRSRSDKLIESALSHLRVDLQAERNAVQHVLTSAKKAFGELSDGTSYRAMIGSASGLVRMSEEEKRTVVTEMEKLGRMKGQLDSSVVGTRKNLGLVTLCAPQKSR